MKWLDGITDSVDMSQRDSERQGNLASCSPGVAKSQTGLNDLTATKQGRSDAENEAPILWPPDAKSQLIGKDLDAGKD